MWKLGGMIGALSGEWRLERSLEDLRSGQPIGTMSGEAAFTVQERDIACYSEDGLLVLDGGQSVQARRDYHYREQKGALLIFFDPAREHLFHRLELRNDGDGHLHAEDVHTCTPDRYEGRYDFLPDGSFVIVHKVNGPRKSYLSRTVYRR